MYHPRLPFERLTAHYGSAEQALRVGDLLSAVRMADDDPTILAPALIMAGNEPAGLRHAVAADATPLLQFTRAVGAWLTGDDAEAAHHHAALNAHTPDHPGNRLLTAAFTTSLDGFVYYTTSPERDGFADYLKRWYGPQVTVVGHYPAHVDICIGIDTPTEALVRALPRPPSFVLINQLNILPRGILGLPFPKIAYTTDIEFFWAARSRELDVLDCIIVGNSSDHVELGLRTAAPLLQRPAALTQTFDAPLRIDREVRDRPIDIATTGSIDSAFYPEKQIRFIAAGELSTRFDIRLLGQLFTREEYKSLLARSKYMITSCRSTHAVLGRQIEAILQGAIVLAPEHPGLPLLLDTCESGVVEYPTLGSNAGISAALAGYDDIHARFAAHTDQLEGALNATYPHGTRGARRLLRYLHMAAAMARSGLRWTDLYDGRAARSGRETNDLASGCSTVRWVHLTGYRNRHRGAILRSALRAADAGGGGRVVPQATELAAAIAFESISDVDAHLIRLLDMGRAKARGRVMHVLNAARKRDPQCLAAWFQLGEFLYARRRFTAAERVFARILTDDALRLGERPYIIDPGNEFSDFPFVDALIRDRLDRLVPPADAGGAAASRGQGRARDLLVARVMAMQAHIDVACGRDAAAIERLDHALSLARYDVPVHEMLLLLGRVLVERTGDGRVLSRMIVTYCQAARRAIYFAHLYFPLILNAATVMRRERLVALLLRRWLRFKARLQCRPGPVALNESEAGALAPHAGLAVRLIEDLSGTPLHAELMPILQQIGASARAA